jgi:hypothetical protein
MGLLRDMRGGPRRPNPAHFDMEKVFYSGADMSIHGTESELREVAEMARLEGTGKDPEGRYGKGLVFDVPAWDPVYDELIEKGWAKTVSLEDDPGRSKTQIANAMVRGDLISHPIEAKLASEIDMGDAYGITHTGDPDATWDDANPEPGSVRGIQAFGEMEADMSEAQLKEYRKAAGTTGGREAEATQKGISQRQAAREEAAEAEKK